MTVTYAKILLNAGEPCRLLLLSYSGASDNLKPFIPSDLQYDVIHSRQRNMFPKLVRYIRDLQPKTIFVSGPYYCHMVCFAKILRLTDAKVILREINMPHTFSRVSKICSRILYRFADIVVVQTEAMRKEALNLYKLSPNKVRTIYNPIDKSSVRNGIVEQSEIDKKCRTFLAVGRVDPQKDYATLLRAFSIVRGIVPDSRLYIVGNMSKSGYVEYLMSLAEELEISGAVKFCGQQINPYKYMNDCDVFVLSSIYEGLPNAMIEAMYLGKPVAATRCIPYIINVIKDGINGWTAEPEDADGLAKAMIESLKISGLEKIVDINDSDAEVLKLFCS